VFLFLSKLVPVFVYPLGLAIMLGILSLVLAAFGRRRLAGGLLALILVGLWVASAPAFANWAYAGLEARYKPVPVADLPAADVTIVLGGIAGQPLPPRVTLDLGEPADRVIQAFRLYKAGKTANILVSGGNLPWQTAVAPEAELVGDLLVELGVPREAIALETQSRNTRENATASAEIMKARGWRSALLVTSGAHMPRAMAIFRRAGLEVTPAPTDIRVRYPLYDSVLDFLPSAAALERTSDAIKEWLGIAVYRFRGWA
jgi:uncharacterized SAM-binding protein YcdF (DUF218 family)